MKLKRYTVAARWGGPTMQRTPLGGWTPADAAEQMIQKLRVQSMQNALRAAVRATAYRALVWNRTPTPSTDAALKRCLRAERLLTRWLTSMQTGRL